MNEELDFKFLDDLAIAFVRGSDINVDQELARRLPLRIGPLLELVNYRRAKVLPRTSLRQSLVLDCLTKLYKNKDRPQFFVDKNSSSGVGFTFANTENEYWNQFCFEAYRAAGFALPTREAAGLIAAMRELADNIHCHSERVVDSIIGFRGSSSEFEFSCMDSGIGILNSLKKSPKYFYLNDYGTALKEALTEGVSRYNNERSGRGCGFRSIFVGIANLNGELRFRSGDHALIINGNSPKLIDSTLDQKVEMPGFLASVVCKI